MIKKIIQILLLILLFISPAFADINISLKVSKENISLDDTFSLDVIIKSDNEEGWEISVTWMENFQIISSWQKQNIQSINGVQTSVFSLFYSLMPKSEGSFVIWPAIIKTWTWEIKSNLVNIVVSWNQNTNPSPVKQNNIDNNKQENINKDIYWVKRTLIFWNSNFIYYFFLLLLFISIFYFALNKYLWPEDGKKEIKKVEVSEKTLITIELRKLDKNSESYSKADFYRELNIIFRRYFKYLWLKSADNLSLNEIELNSSLLNKTLLSLFKESYFLEFSSEEDKTEIRKGIIKKLLTILKK